MWVCGTHIYVCMQVCKCVWYTCVWIETCAYVYMHVETRGWCQVSSSTVLHFTCLCRVSHLNPDLAGWASLESQPALGILSPYAEYWDYWWVLWHPATMHIWYFCEYWKSELCFPHLYSKLIIHRAISPTSLLLHFFILQKSLQLLYITFLIIFVHNY